MGGYDVWTKAAGAAGGSARQSAAERLATAVLVLTGAVLFLVLLFGRFSVASGPLRFNTSHVRGPLIWLLALGILKQWLRRNRTGVPGFARVSSPLCLFLMVMLVYSLPVRAVWSGDVVPARYLPLSLLRKLDLDLDEFPFLHERGLPYFLHRTNGHVVSAYPPWGAVLATPVYLLPVLGGAGPDSHLVPEAERLSAALITAASAIVLYWTLRRLTKRNIAWLISLVYALGTSSFSVSSQELWQHGPAQLFLALTLYLLIRGVEEAGTSAYSGFTLASAVICRPADVVIAVPILGYVVHQRRQELLRWATCAMPPTLVFMAYNGYYYGSPLSTGFASFVVTPSWIGSAWSSGLFGTPFSEGLAGLLISPSRGLLVYSPVLALSFVGMAMVWRNSPQVLLKYVSVAPVLLLLLTAKWGMWWGGHTYGPRLLADVAPILCLYLFPVCELAQARAWVRYLLIGLSALSIGLHALGAFSDGSWNRFPVSIDRHPDRLWSWRGSPPAHYLARTVSAVAETLSSPDIREGRKRAAIHAFISRFYREATRTAPDPVAVKFWVSFLRERCDTSNFALLAEWLFDSSEVWESRPLAPEDLVTVLYRSLLGRDPGRDGLAYWGSQMRHVALRRWLEEILPPATSRTPLPIQSDRSAVSAVVTRLYRVLLKRDPDPADLAYWVGYITDTHDVVGATAAVLTTPEFERQAVPLQHYVPLLYRVFQGGEPPRTDRAFFDERLRTNLLGAVRRGFLDSEEFQGIVAGICMS